MRILLTNDDGIESKGITALEEALVAKGHEIWVCAPESQRSSCSHAVSINKEVPFSKVSDRHYASWGFPSDCVFFACKGVIDFPGPLDLVISGINQGYNVSTDVIYSATCGAASEAVLKGYKGIAVSCGPKDGVFCFEKAAEFVADNLDFLYKSVPEGAYLNVNIPPENDGSWKETVLGKIEYFDTLHEGKPGTYYVCGARPPMLTDCKQEGTDFYCVHNEKKVSLTAVRIYPSTCSIEGK